MQNKGREKKSKDLKEFPRLENLLKFFQIDDKQGKQKF